MSMPSSDEPIPSSIDGTRYQLCHVIGKGSYGTVYAGFDRQTNNHVAIKHINNVFDNVGDTIRILREIKLLHHFTHHADVVSIKHIILPSNPATYKDLYLVFEIMDCDLHTVIGANDDLTPDHHRVFLYQMLRGLAFIHETGVLHRDLKPKNILVNCESKLKICDFGLARPFFGRQEGDMPTMWTDYVATRWYRAPELCGCFYGRYSQAVDMWSIGCIFAETLLRKPLFPGKDAVSQLLLITDLIGKPPSYVIERISNIRARKFLHALSDKRPAPLATKFGRNADPQAMDLLQRLLSFDPVDRPSAVQALQHPYFQGLSDVPFQAPAPIPATDFEFETRNVTLDEVRVLIYIEALQYHPHILEQYSAATNRLSAQMAHIDMGSMDNRMSAQMARMDTSMGMGVSYNRMPQQMMTST